MSSVPIGLQLYTVRSLMQQDADGTLAQIASIGYMIVETAGTYGLTADAFRELLDAHGLRTPSGHYGLAALRDDLDGTLATAKTLGQQYVIAPYVDASERQSMDDFRGLAHELNDLGATVKDAGLRFGYHNHDFEFETFGGETPALDVLLDETDPDLVLWEMDVYWVVKGGGDPLRLMQRHPGRVRLIHAKDASAAPEQAMVDVGAGVIDFKAIVEAGAADSLAYALVEHDHPGDAIASVRNSYAYLKGL